jgi:hypothetical protein
MSHYYQSSSATLVESDREAILSDRASAMPHYYRSTLDPLGENDRDSVSSGRTSISSDHGFTALPVASFSQLRVYSPSQVALTDLGETRPMSITGTHFDILRPPTNSSEVLTIDTEYRGRTQPYAVLSNNYYARVASADGRRSTSLLLEGVQVLDDVPDKDPYLV